MNDKEKFILNVKPTLCLAKLCLNAYKCKLALGYFTAVLALQMETSEFPVDFFNEYSLTLGRSSQGVTQFKTAMISMVDKSKKIPTKPDLKASHESMQIPTVYAKQAQLADRLSQTYMQL